MYCYLTAKQEVPMPSSLSLEAIVSGSKRSSKFVNFDTVLGHAQWRLRLPPRRRFHRAPIS